MDSRQHWEQVFSSSAETEVSWYQAEPGISLAMIERAGLDADDPVIDVGGGTSVLAERMVQRDYRDVSVLDISATAMAKSQAKLGAGASAIHWITADIRHFRPARQYALWHDRALLHFMVEAEDRRAYAAALRDALRSGGQAVLAAFAIGGPRKCSGLDIVQYDADRVLDTLGDGFELLEQEHEAHRTPAGHLQRFEYFRLRRT